MSTIVKSSIYGTAVLFSLAIYLLFVRPINFADTIQQPFVVHIVIFVALLLFPLLIAWLFITRGKSAFFIAVPFYLIGLFFLYRGFYMENQFSILDYLFIEIQQMDRTTTPAKEAASFIGLESFFLYIIISEFGILLAYFLKRRKGKTSIC
ncbi:hypothetical protein BKP35_09845 [Anaerobacillus arseniciselenatis]|uniref:Uncharacterized protein n=1 Tax=Anaerobacillus arseniciselenatis TaxID=85682 RepID=A0A1S2LKB1_9BACI|nr:hypothetical protein [Anaerobacillus arseniciselenatis]OIJ12861.1 hypothetical protein BKP35_09845 [Anaerobacillus arseniciselenatis]